MTIPAGYLQLVNALWVKVQDASGPYMIDSAGTVTPFAVGPVPPPPPPPAPSPSLDFSDAANSMYVPVLAL